MRLFIILTIAALIFGCSKKVVKTNEFGDSKTEYYIKEVKPEKIKKVEIVPEIVKKPIYINSTLLFDFDSDRLRPGAMNELDGLIIEIEKYPNCLILLQGNACKIGTHEYNYSLAERRAESVQKYILLHLPEFTENQIRIVSFGEGHCNVDKSRYSECRNVNYTVSE